MHKPITQTQDHLQLEVEGHNEGYLTNTKQKNTLTMDNRQKQSHLVHQHTMTEISLIFQYTSY